MAWRCDECNPAINFKSNASLSRHVKEKHRHRRFRCRFCSKVFKRRYHAVKHANKAHEAEIRKLRIRAIIRRQKMLKAATHRHNQIKAMKRIILNERKTADIQCLQRGSRNRKRADHLCPRQISGPAYIQSRKCGVGGVLTLEFIEAGQKIPVGATILHIPTESEGTLFKRQKANTATANGLVLESSANGRSNGGGVGRMKHEGRGGFVLDKQAAFAYGAGHAGVQDPGAGSSCGPGAVPPAPPNSPATSPQPGFFREDGVAISPSAEACQDEANHNKFAMDWSDRHLLDDYIAEQDLREANEEMDIVDENDERFLVRNFDFAPDEEDEMIRFGLSLNANAFGPVQDGSMQGVVDDASGDTFRAHDNANVPQDRDDEMQVNGEGQETWFFGESPRDNANETNETCNGDAANLMNYREMHTPRKS